MGMVVCAAGWLLVARAQPELQDLSPEVREGLVREMFEVSPGVCSWSWYEPGIVFTLHPSATITAWEDTFTSNEIGFRTGSLEKSERTFRLVLVGDSWTYGMGVSENQTFAKIVERLIREHADLDRPVDVRTIALPGYNTLNQASAFWYHFDQLDPDVVIWCPCSNDNGSSPVVLPNGSQWARFQFPDEFGDPHAVNYRIRAVDSYRWKERWKKSLTALRESEARLDRLGIPMMYFFVAIWRPELVHGLVSMGGLHEPYILAPARFNLGEWANPEPLRHGNASAHELYAHWIYEGLAEQFDWPHAAQVKHGDEAPLHRHPPEGTDWLYAMQTVLDASTRKLPTHFTPSASVDPQCVGPISRRTGSFARATTLLVRRVDGALTLRLKVARTRPSRSLYPMTLTVTIPSDRDTQRRTFQLFENSKKTRIVNVPIPEDIAVGAAIDVTLTVDRAAAAPGNMGTLGIRVLSITQE